MCYIYRYEQHKILICIRKMDGTTDYFVKARFTRLRKINSPHALSYEEIRKQKMTDYKGGGRGTKEGERGGVNYCMWHES